MHKNENLIAEFKVIAAKIKSQYLTEWISKVEEVPDKKMDTFMVVFSKFQRDLAGEGTMILHKSMMEGVDDTWKLIEGVRQVNLETAQSFMTEVKSS